MDAKKRLKSYRFSGYLFFISKVTLTLSLLLFFYVGAKQFNLSDYFPIKTVAVRGLERLSPIEIKNLLFPLVNHGFFNADVDYIKNQLVQLPWASSVFVRRVWPDKIDITVREKKPTAIWNNECLLSSNGELFLPKEKSYFNNLPKLIGPNGKQVFILGYFKQIKTILAPLKASIARLELTPFLSFKLSLNDGTTLQIGHKDILTRLTQFVTVYPKIMKGRADSIAYADLRYPNGVAVQFKSTKI